MMKIWTSSEKKDTKIFAIRDDMLYYGNPSAGKVAHLVSDFEMNLPVPDLFSLPVSYIDAIQYQESKDYIQIFFRKDSEDRIVIADAVRRGEVFEFLKTIRPNTRYDIIKPEGFQAYKKQYIALLVTLVLFFWTIILAVQIESGNEYDVAGGHYHSVTGIILALANLGVPVVLCIFIPLIVLSVLAVYRKQKNPPVYHRLFFK